MFTFTDTRKSIKEITSMFENGSLIVDGTYQRRSIWNEKDKIRLIETVLLKLVIPEIFFWKAETDPDSGESITHIVDGQQRIKAICSFVNNEFRLKKQYLMDKSTAEKYGDKFFVELEAEDKKEFWNYLLMVIDIDPSASREDIITMFNRLNLTDYSLNDQEKRNSKSGEFAALARELSENPIWENKHLFSITDIKRMKDVEFCASLILLYRKGVIDQTDQTELNAAYEDLHSGYIDAEKDKSAVLDAIEVLPKFFVSDEVIKFLKKKTQLYTLFSIIFDLQEHNIQIEEKSIQNLEKFIELYSLFNNDMELSLTEEEKIVFDWLKKYKLASSEGLNKHTNRMIRKNVMKDFMFPSIDEMDGIESSLLQKMKAIKMEPVEDPEE